MTKDTTEKPSLSAEASGAYYAVTTDDLSQVVLHMKRSNGFVKETNKELISLNKSMTTQNHLLVFSACVGLLLVLGLVYSLYEQRGLRTMMRDNALASSANTLKLADVAERLLDTQKAAEDTQKAVEEQPTITVKPADAGDPTSKPTLIVLPKVKRLPKPKNYKKGDPPPVEPPAPKGIEIPLDIPHKKK